MAPKTAPPTTLPAITPGLGVPSLDTVSVTVAVATRDAEEEVDEDGGGPRLPFSLGRPGQAVVMPAEVR